MVSISFVINSPNKLLEGCLYGAASSVSDCNVLLDYFNITNDYDAHTCGGYLFSKICYPPSLHPINLTDACMPIKFVPVLQKKGKK